MSNQEISQNKVHDVSSLLGLYKAEWLDNKVFELFNEPHYFGELKTRRPCVLIGGRGTGKTTVLRGLSYQGQYEFCNRNAATIQNWDFFGLYYRINTNRVTAFRGPELHEDKWADLFAHYLNLIFCQLLLDFARWFELQTGLAIQISRTGIQKVQVSLGLGQVETLGQLAELIELEILQFESRINNLLDFPNQRISMQGAPLDVLADELIRSPELEGKQFFFLIDEYENLEDYQQKVFNTLIKHATPAYTFKVGVRELGWRQRATRNAHEQLTSPADYARIDISEVLSGTRFRSFAEEVIGARLARVASGHAFSITHLLPGLTDSEEAEILLEGYHRDEFLTPLKGEFTKAEYTKARGLPLKQLYFARKWAMAKSGRSYAEVVREAIADGPAWKTRFDNHFHAYLFSIRKGKRGIRKYYCGWDVYLSLANRNIRYLLELVHAAFLQHIAEEGPPFSPISPKNQTIAATQIGRKKLSELESVSVEGAKLTKLLLSVGRVFQVFAEDPEGHAPEVNQFFIPPDELPGPADERVNTILQHAVMHLALVRSTGNKLADESDTREYDYMVHPVFAPFFVFSHRKKRKIPISASQILGLIETPKTTIKGVLSKNNREEDSLPDQLQLFGSFYA